MNPTISSAAPLPRDPYVESKTFTTLDIIFLNQSLHIIESTSMDQEVQQVKK
jgi:hypothetical protein